MNTPNAIRLAALTAALALTACHMVKTASPESALIAEATTLETVVVTPTARYTPSEWQARVASRNAVTLDRVIVTPSRSYSVAEWQAEQGSRQVALR